MVRKKKGNMKNRVIEARKKGLKRKRRDEEGTGRGRHRPEHTNSLQVSSESRKRTWSPSPASRVRKSSRIRRESTALSGFQVYMDDKEKGKRKRTRNDEADEDLRGGRRRKEDIT